MKGSGTEGQGRVFVGPGRSDCLCRGAHGSVGAEADSFMACLPRTSYRDMTSTGCRWARAPGIRESNVKALIIPASLPEDAVRSSLYTAKSGEEFYFNFLAV